MRGIKFFVLAVSAVLLIASCGSSTSSDTSGSTSSDTSGEGSDTSGEGSSASLPNRVTLL